MSSFKRKNTAKETTPIGTRALPGPVTTFVTSTGVPSLDDILGGGLPLTCDLLILAPDVHTAYGELLQKYFIAQGLSSGQDVCVIDDSAKEFVSDCMWMPSGDVQPSPVGAVEEDEEEEGKDPKTKIKIAWRYEQLKQFQTTVSTSQNEDLCKVFDLTTRIPSSVVEGSCASGRLKFLDVDGVSESGSSSSCTRKALSRIEEILGAEQSDGGTRTPLRLCIPSLGSPQWGDLKPHDVCSFLHSLRVILKRYAHAVAAISLSPHLCSESCGGPGWSQKLGWLSDTCLSLSAFSASPSLTSMFPAHHGFVHVHSLPAPHSLQPSSDKFSTLRGLSSSGENNLAFKCMRKRLVFETLHLDLEGGVGERRTTPSTVAAIVGETAHTHSHAPSVKGEAAVEVKLEQIKIETRVHPIADSDTPVKKPKPKKKVAFHSDRPDLYDF